LPAGLGVLDLGHHAARQDLRIGEDLVVMQYGTGGNAFGFERGHPLGGRALDDLGLQDRHDRLVVLHTQRVGRKARIVGQRRLADHLAELAEEILLRRADRQPAVGGLEHLIRRGAAMTLPQLLRPQPVGEIVRRLVNAERDCGLEQRRLDPLALARLVPRLQGRQHADREIETRADIGDGERNAIGRPVLRPGHRHQPRHRLHHQIEATTLGVRTGLSEARDRTQHQARVARMQRRPADAEPVDHTGTKVLQHDIGAVDQLPEGREIVGILEIEPQAALVAVPQHEGR